MQRLKILQSLGRFLGMLAFALNTRMKKVTKVNLQICFPELSEQELLALTRSSLQATAQVLTEASILAGRTENIISKYITRVKGEEVFKQKNSKGVLLLVPHFGNWEFINLFVSHEYNMQALYAPPKQNYMLRPLLAFRKKHGGELYPATAFGVRQVLKALKQGRIVGLLPDQVPERKAGLHVPFFGVPALTMTLVARLIQRTGAQVVFGYARRLPEAEGFELVFSAAESAVYDTNEYISLSAINAGIEKIVSLHREQYQWEYKRFKRGADRNIDIYKDTTS